MEEMNKVGDEVLTNGVSESDKQESVAYDSYKRVLDERKRDKERAQQALQEAEQLKAQLKEIERNKMEAAGEKDALISSLREELAETQKSLSTTKASYGDNVVMDKLKAEAMQAGLDSEDWVVFKALVKEKGLKSRIELGENFSVNKEDLTAVVDRVKMDHRKLFTKSSPRVIDGKPAPVETGSKSSTDMSDDELFKELGYHRR